MLHTTLVLLALALLATVLATSGCGGSSKSGSTGTPTTAAAATPATTTAAGTTVTTASIPAVTVKVSSGKPLTRAQWIAKANALCTSLKNELSLLHVKFAAEFARTLPQEAAYVRVEVAHLAQLVPPASEASNWQQFLNASLQWAEGDMQMLKYANQGAHILTSPTARSTFAIYARVLAIAKRSGLNACSK